MAEQQSRFAKRPYLWLPLGIVIAFVPLLWPVGIYLLWKVFSAQRSVRSVTTAAAPQNLQGSSDGWR